MRVLVIDHDSEARALLVSLIQALGHTPQEALMGRDALNQCRQTCPDLIFVELKLPNADGMEVIRQIRQLGGNAVWVPIVLMSAQLDDKAISQGMEAGADDFLTKPISKVRLEAKLRSVQKLLEIKSNVIDRARDLNMADRALESIVDRDVLTGLGDSNAFEDALEREWFKAKQNQYPLSMILIDLDYFQAYNQRYGAEKGDQCIKQVAEAIRTNFPLDVSLLSRTRGTTFSVLLPNLEQPQAVEMAQKLQTAINALQIPHESSGLGKFVTASMGVSTIRKDQFTRPWDLTEAADFALYQAKHAGRNRFSAVYSVDI